MISLTNRTTQIKSALIGAVSLGVLAGGLVPASAADPNPQPAAAAVNSTVSPSTVNIGDTFKVTSTATTPFAAANTSINTAIPKGAKFKSVEPAPAGLTLQYSTDKGATWVNSPPPAAQITNVRAAGNLSQGKSDDGPVAPLQPTGALTFTGGGDGFNPIFFKDQIWVANHHEPAGLARWLKCFDRITGNPCAGFSAPGNPTEAVGKYISQNAGDNFGTGGSTLSTPQESVTYVNQADGHIYVPVQVQGPAASKTAVGWVCGDLNTQKSCGFTQVGSEDAPNGQLPDSAVYPNFLPTQIWGRETTNPRQYALGKSGAVYCFNVATGADCTVRPNTPTMPLSFQYFVNPGGEVPSAINHWPSFAVAGANYDSATPNYGWLVAPGPTNNDAFFNARVSCVNLDTGEKCGVAGLTGYTGGGIISNSFGVPTPVYNTNKSFQAMCFQIAAVDAAAQPSWRWDCRAANGTGIPTLVAAASTKLNSAMPAATSGFDLPAAGNVVLRAPSNPAQYYARNLSEIPYITQGKLYIPLVQNWPTNPANAYDADNMVACLDYTTGAPCAGFTPPEGRFGDNLVYTVAEDTPDCMWWMGDKGRLQAFDAKSGQLGCDNQSISKLTITPPPDCSPDSLSGAKYSEVRITDFIPNQIPNSDWEISVYDKKDQLVKSGTVTPANPALDISSIPVSGDTSSLNIIVIWRNPGQVAQPQMRVQAGWTQDKAGLCVVMEPLPDCPETADWTTVETMATFTPPTGAPATANDYVEVTVNRRGSDCSARLQKYIDRQEGNSTSDYEIRETPPGMDFPVGAPVYYMFEVWTPGTWSLGTPVLVDNNATPNNPADNFNPTYYRGDTNANNRLDPGERWLYRSTLPQALQGVHTNTATLNVPGANNNDQTSQANYNAEPPSIDVVKRTNGTHATQPGLEFVVGDSVTWTYTVTNTGRSELKNISLVDNKVGVITCPSTTLAAQASMVCTANGTTVEGTYVNQATVTGEDPWGQKVTDKDDNTYKGLEPKINIVKKINGAGNLDTADGVRVPVNSGDNLSITFLVTNIGTAPLINVSVVDAPLPALTPQTKASCPSDKLAPGDSMTCTASGTALVGTHDDKATVVGTGTFTNGQPLKKTDGTPYPNVTAESKAGYVAKDQLPIIVDPVDEDRFGDGYTTLIKDSSTSPQGVIKRRVFCRPYRPSAAGEIAYCKVRVTKKGAVKVRIKGYGKVKVTVQITAKPKPQYKGQWTANSWRRTWILRGNTTLR